MSNIYNSIKERKPGKKLARIAGIIIMIAVWILIDKGNIYGQSISDRDVISKSALKSDVQSPSFRKGEDVKGDELPTVDEGDLITARPNPVQQELVFDFEFTVKENGIPYEVLDPLGRISFQGVFEPGINRHSLDFSSMKKGMYLVRMDLGGKLIVKRIIKQ